MRSRWIARTVVALSGCLALAACSGSGDASSPRTTVPTPLTKLDVASVRVARAGFCDRLPKAAVRAALGSAPADTSSWKSGDPPPTGTPGDVAHEFGCAWTGANGAAARAWVFASPVTAAYAASIIKAADRAKECESDLATVFGNPAMLETCPRPGGLERVRRAGLFGDTWLTCELDAPVSLAEKARRSRLDVWCAQVVAALDVG
jgi:hypothetical protein